MLLCCIPCFLVINLRFIRGCTRTISTNLCFFLVYQLNIFPFNFGFVNYSVVYKSKAEPLEHTKKRDTGHQSVSLENKTGDSTMLKIGNSAKVVIKQDMKGRRHKYGFSNNKREKAEKKRVLDDETGDKHQLDEIMGSPPASIPPPPSPPPPPPPSDASASSSAVKRTRKASRLRSLSTRPPGAERPVVHIDPATGKADGPHRKKLRTYLVIVVRDKVNITYENWKEVPTAQKDLIWEDIQAEFDIPEASDSRTKRKLLQTVRERWRQFKSYLTRKWALAADQDGVEDTVCEKYDINKEKWAQFFQTRRDPSWKDVRMKAQAIQKQNTAPHVLSRGGYDYLEQKLLAEKMKKKLEKAAQLGSVDGVIDPPSPIRRHVKWKMARMKKTGEMTTEATKEIAEKIDVLATAIGGPEHPGRVRAAGAGVTIKQYFGSAPRTSRIASSLPPDELQQLTQQIRDQLNESIIEKVTRQVMASFSQLQSQMQSQGLAVPPEPLVGPSGPRVSTKGSCVDPSGNDPETGDSDRCGLYIKADLARLVAMGRVYEGSTVVHNSPLLPGQVKVSVEEVTDADAPVPVPTDEVSLVGQALHTFLAWPTHLVKSLSQQVAVSPAKPPPKPDPEVDDPLYLMRLTIPELFLRPYQVRWDATVFGVFNPDFPLYIKHEDLYEIAHGGQCLSISVLQLWILNLTETCMRVGNSNIYGFLEPQSIQSGHWQMVVILPKEHLVVWFCSLHNRPDNYLKGIINSAIKGLDDAPQPKSKVSARWIVVKCNRQKGSTECGYYMMHWMSTIILGTFRNNWEAIASSWDETMFGVYNDNVPLHMNELKMNAEFTKRCLLESLLEWVNKTEQINLNNVICPKDNVVVWFCSLHNNPDNYFKGMINSALKRFNEKHKSKFKATAKWILVKFNKQIGNTECNYYAMHWMSTIVQARGARADEGRHEGHERANGHNNGSHDEYKKNDGEVGLRIGKFDYPTWMNRKPGENGENEKEGETHVVAVVPTWPNFPLAQQYQYSANISPSHYPPTHEMPHHNLADFEPCLGYAIEGQAVGVGRAPPAMAEKGKLDHIEERLKDIEEYAQRWRDLAAQVAPPITEKEIITMIVDTLPMFYYEKWWVTHLQVLQIWSSPAKGSKWANLIILLGRLRKLGQMKRVRMKEKPMLRLPFLHGQTSHQPNNVVTQPITTLLLTTTQGLHILTIRGLNVLAIRGLHALTFRGLHILTFRGLHALTFRELHVLTIRGLHALTFRGLHVLAFRELHILAFRGLHVLTFRRLHVLTFIGLHVLTFRGLDVLAFRGLHVLTNRGPHALTFRALHVLTIRGLHALAFRGLHVLAIRGLHDLTFRGLHVLAFRGLHALAIGGLHALTFRGLHALAFRGLLVHTIRGLHVLTIRGLHVLTIRGLHILAFRGLHVLTFRGLHALAFRGLHVLTFRGLHVLAIRGLHARTFRGLHILAIRGLDSLGFRGLHVLVFRGLHALAFRGLHALAFRGLHALAFRGLHALAFRGLRILTFIGLYICALREFKTCAPGYGASSFLLSVPGPPPNIGGRPTVRAQPEREAITQLLCIPGQDFTRAAAKRRVRVMRTNMTTLTQIWMTLLLSNIPPDDHNVDLPPMEVSVGLCRHDIGITPTRHLGDPEKSNRALGFPALVTGLCQSYRVPIPPASSCHRDIGITPVRHSVDPEKSNRVLGFPTLIMGLCQFYGVPVTPQQGNRRTAATSKAPQLIYKSWSVAYDLWSTSRRPSPKPKISKSTRSVTDKSSRIQLNTLKKRGKALLLSTTPPFVTVTQESGGIRSHMTVGAAHASSTIESGAPRIDCLALFVHPPSLSPEPHELIAYVVRASSIIESGAPRIDCLALFVHPPSLSLKVASGGNNPARLGELGGNLLPIFPINRQNGAVLRISNLPGYAFQLFWVKKIVSVKKIQAEVLSLSQPTLRWGREKAKNNRPKRLSPREKMSRVTTNVYSRKTLEKPKR
ncbi:Dynein heavy chain [Glycine soja]